MTADPTIIAARLITDLIRSGADITSDLTQLDRAHDAVAALLDVLHVDQVDDEKAPGAFLRCIVAGQRIRRNERLAAQRPRPRMAVVR